jgi:hypothetical protein
MSSPIMPFNGPPLGSPRPIMPAREPSSEPAPLQGEPTAFQGDPAPLQGEPTPLQDEPAVDHRALSDEQIEAGPPHEVLDQIEAAGRISRRLHESGQEMRFTLEQGGRVRIELQNREGKTVRSLLAAEALDIAAGKPLS